jgi:hypothetical protein
MKKIYLATNNILGLIRNNSLILYVIFIGITLSVFGILFYSGYFFENFYSSQVSEKVYFEIKKNADKDKIKELLKKIKVNDDNVMTIYVSDDNPEECKVVGGYDYSWNNRMLVGKVNSIDSEEPNVIVAECSLEVLDSAVSPIGNEVVCDNDKFSISGIAPFTEYDNYVVPVTYYINNYDVRYINVHYRKNIRTGELRKALRISEIVKDYKVKKNIPFTSEDFVSSFIQILLIFSVVITNVFCMTYYLMKKFKKKFTIYSICGATPKDILVITVIQTLIIMICGTVVANILYALFISCIKDYGIVYCKNYLPYFITSLLVMIILIIFSVLLAGRTTKEDTIYYVVD